MKRFSGLLVVMPLLWGCGEGEPENDAATTDPSLLPARVDFRTHCSVCHGKGGKGAPKLFPPLVDSEWVEGDPEAAIRIVLHGLDGPLKVNGKRFFNKMAPLGHVLTDEQIAGILTYVRASWGNSASPVSPEEVARVREATLERETEWTEEELRGLLGP